MLNDGISFLNLRFENDVKMYGTQTYDMDKKGSRQFFNISLEITE